MFSVQITVQGDDRHTRRVPRVRPPSGWLTSELPLSSEAVQEGQVCSGQRGRLVYDLAHTLQVDGVDCLP